MLRTLHGWLTTAFEDLCFVSLLTREEALNSFLHDQVSNTYVVLPLPSECCASSVETKIGHGRKDSTFCSRRQRGWLLRSQRAPQVSTPIPNGLSGLMTYRRSTKICENNSSRPFSRPIKRNKSNERSSILLVPKGWLDRDQIDGRMC